MPEVEKIIKQLRAENTALRQRLGALEAVQDAHGQTLAALQASKRRYRHLMDHSLGLLCIHDLDGMILELNAAAAQALGYQRQESVGRRLQDFLAPAAQAQFEAYLERIRRQATDSGLTRVVTQTGQERTWLYRNVRYEEPGRPPCVLGHAVDITERKRVEAALRASEATQRRLAQEQAVLTQIGRLMSATRNIADVYESFADEVRKLFPCDRLTISLVDADTRTIVRTYVAGMASAGRRPEAPDPFAATLTEKTVVTQAGCLFHPQHELSVQRQFPGLLPLYRGGLRSFLAVPLTSRAQVVGVLQAQAQRPNAYTDCDLHLAARVSTQIAGAIASVRFYAERLQAEEALREREVQLHQMQKMEALGTLAGGIAHEFNNILTAILGFTNLAQNEVPRRGVVWSNLHEVLKAGHRAKDLVQQLLTFSRPNTHDRQPVRVALVVREALALMRATLPSTIEIQPDMAADDGVVLANQTQLHQVVFNLCANAAYAMRENGGLLEVTVDTVEVGNAWETSHPHVLPGPYVRLRVRDTGHGIAPELRERIFEPFFTTKEIGEGSGMGLTVVHAIVMSHGGAMTVESTPGTGAAFTIYLPRLVEAVAALEVPVQVKDLPTRGQGRILFVDDEEMLVRLGQGVLEHLGYEVVGYTSSLDALNAFRAEPHRYDLVVTDQTMPRMTGATLVEELRCIRADIPIVLCTGFSHLMDAEKAQTLGVDAFVMKPGVTLELAVAIQQILQRRAAEGA